MYSTRKINLIHLSVLFLIVAGLAGTIQARTVYVITDRSSTVKASVCKFSKKSTEPPYDFPVVRPPSGKSERQYSQGYDRLAS